MHTTRTAVHQRTSIALALLLLLPACINVVRAALERETALVTIAEANAQSLIESGTMPAEKARSLVSGFLDAARVSAKQRKAVRNGLGFSALMESYINDQGGCKSLLRKLK